MGRNRSVVSFAVIALAASLSLSSQTADAQPIEGFGSISKGGAGGEVYRVTSLADSGPGSLRYGLANRSQKPLTILFDVGGTIVLKGDIVINQPFLTIDGTSAPSPGITIRQDTFNDGFPHEYFEFLRREHPVALHPETEKSISRFRPGAPGKGFYAITKHADIVQVSKNPKIFSSWWGTNIPDSDEMQLNQLRLLMLNMDPPQHVKFRQLVRSGFTPTKIKQLHADVQALAAHIVDKVAASVARMLQSDAVRERIVAAGFSPAPQTSGPFAEYFNGEVTRWARLIEEKHIRAE